MTRVRFTAYTDVSPNQTAGSMSAWEDQLEDSLLMDPRMTNPTTTGREA